MGFFFSPPHCGLFASRSPAKRAREIDGAELGEGTRESETESPRGWKIYTPCRAYTFELSKLLGTGGWGWGWRGLQREDALITLINISREVWRSKRGRPRARGFRGGLPNAVFHPLDPVSERGSSAIAATAGLTRCCAAICQLAATSDVCERPMRPIAESSWGVRPTGGEDQGGWIIIPYFNVFFGVFWGLKDFRGLSAGFF